MIPSDENDETNDLSDDGAAGYVSGRHHLPLAEPQDSRITLGGIVGCAILLVAGCGGVYGIYRLIALVIR